MDSTHAPADSNGSGNGPKAGWDIEVFHDGGCPLCNREIEMLRRLDTKGRIKFTDIARLVEQVLELHKTVTQPSMEYILAADEWARQAVSRLVKEIA